ncbi:hypothetical protein J4732_12460 [Serratia marcescens]|uniref:Uncharacterized protein n=1 Tax=Serratia marcescens TaxID=615 RepID=A0A939SNR7_SERMA|nr:hypothetical protein [Serratia marcescens]
MVYTCAQRVEQGYLCAMIAVKRQIAGANRKLNVAEFVHFAGKYTPCRPARTFVGRGYQ